MRQLYISQRISIEGEPHLQKYLNELAREHLFTLEEEVAHAKRIRTEQDPTAHAAMIKANLRFVVAVAKQYQNQGLSLGDLISEGNLGLIEAAHKFDETKGYKFISYAVWWIRQYIFQALSEDVKIIRLPMNKVNGARKIQNAFSELEQLYEREPIHEEVYDLLLKRQNEKKKDRSKELSLKDIKEIVETFQSHPSLDTPLNPVDDRLLVEIIADEAVCSAIEQPFLKECQSYHINEALATLSENEVKVVRYYYGLDPGATTLQAIGDTLNLTRERVRQIKARAIKKLQRYARDHKGDMIFI